MRAEIFTFILLFANFLEAVPTISRYEDCPAPVDFQLENRNRFPAKKPPKPTENCDIDEEDDLRNKLFSNFWAIDNLPKRSTFVSIEKMPDVYIDQNDQPCPISDAAAVERSEITEEARDVRIPEFGENNPYQPYNIYREWNRQYPQYPTYENTYNPCVYNVSQAAPKIEEQPVVYLPPDDEEEPCIEKEEKVETHIQKIGKPHKEKVHPTTCATTSTTTTTTTTTTIKPTTPITTTPKITTTKKVEIPIVPTSTTVESVVTTACVTEKIQETTVENTTKIIGISSTTTEKIDKKPILPLK